MMELRYRLTQPPGSPWPFAPWFERTPEASVHVHRVAFDGDAGRARALAVTPEGGDPDALAEDVLSMPLPNGTEWRLDARAGTRLILRAAWQEPIYPETWSPHWIARTVLGSSTRCAFTITRNVVRHRALVPGAEVDPNFWFKLREGMNQYGRFAEVGIQCELERLRPLSIPNDDPRIRTAARTAFELGLFDEEPPVTVEDVAAVLDAPLKLVEEAIHRVDA